MKFMVMHKADAKSETEQLPSQELIANVGNLLKGAMENGTFIDGAGLRSSARRIRVTLSGNERTELAGPYLGQNELVSRVALLKVKTMPEAVEWGARLAAAAGASELEIGPVTEPWDLGVAPRPEGELPLQVLALLKSTTASEADSAGATTAALEALLAEAKQAQVLLATHALLPSARGARIQGPQGARRVFDGPFAESKELIGGYMILSFESKADAVAFGQKYADVVGAHEVDVREVP